MSNEIGRNDRCPCGSGRKHKNCCGRSQSPVHVLYIHPAKFGVGFERAGEPVGRPYGLIPMGLVALVNVLRENGIGVKGLNYPMESLLDERFDLRKWLSGQPDVRVVLIDLHWYEHAYGAIDVARAWSERRLRSLDLTALYCSGNWA